MSWITISERRACVRNGKRCDSGTGPRDEAGGQRQGRVGDRSVVSRAGLRSRLLTTAPRTLSMVGRTARAAGDLLDDEARTWYSSSARSRRCLRFPALIGRSLAWQATVGWRPLAHRAASDGANLVREIEFVCHRWTARACHTRPQEGGPPGKSPTYLVGAGSRLTVAGPSRFSPIGGPGRRGRGRPTARCAAPPAPGQPGKSRLSAPAAPSRREGRTPRPCCGGGCPSGRGWPGR